MVYVFVPVIELFYFIVEYSDCHAINVNTETSMLQRLSIAIAYEETTLRQLKVYYEATRDIISTFLLDRSIT